MTETALQNLDRVVTEAITKYVPDVEEEMVPTASLEEIGIDSMTLVDLVLELQDECSVEFPDDALARILVVQDLVDVLRDLVAARTPTGPVTRRQTIIN